jgi:hypothetical protein
MSAHNYYLCIINKERYYSFGLDVRQVQQIELAVHTYALQILQQLPWQAQS